MDRYRLQPTAAAMKMNFSGQGPEMKLHHEGTKPSPPEEQEGEIALRRYAAICNNIGGILIQRNEMIAAMQSLQESVQTLMSVEDPSHSSQLSKERLDEVTEQLMKLTTEESNNNSKQSSHTLTCSCSVEKICSCPVEGIPGLFGMSSRMSGSEKYTDDPMLAFSEPFRLCLGPMVNGKSGSTGVCSPATKDASKACAKACAKACPKACPIPSSSASASICTDNGTNTIKNGDTSTRREKNRKKKKRAGKRKSEAIKRNSVFIVPMDQCSKVSLFNMGLIHYKWKSLDSAVQFFELSMSLAQPHAPLIFDPVVIACLNNIGQIRLQRNKSNQAKGYFADALTRAKSSLLRMDPSGGGDGTSAPPHRPAAVPPSLMATTPQLVRRFIARTLMNMAWVEFFDCEYDPSMRTCKDAVRLLSPNIDDVDAAALWYDVALIHHHQNERIKALEYIDKFLYIAYKVLGIKHLQIASALHRKSLILFEMGNLYESSKLLHIALRIRKAKLGNDHPLVAEHLVLLGKVYQEREEYCYATSALKSALRIQRSLSQNNNNGSHLSSNRSAQEESNLSFDVAQTLIDLGRALLAQGRLQESLDAYLEVSRITKKFFGEQHIYVAKMLKIIGNIYLEQGKTTEAIKFFTEGMNIHAAQGIPLDYHLVQNPLSWVKFSRHRCAATFA